MTENNVDHFTKQAMYEFSKTLELFNLTPIEAHLYTYLYLANKPLTLDEMSDALGKSKTSISNNIRALTKLNLVSRVWKKGVRKNLYEANTQLLKIFMTSHTHKWKETIQHQKSVLEDIHVSIQQINGHNELLNNQLNLMILFHEQLHSLVKKIEKNI